MISYNTSTTVAARASDDGHFMASCYVANQVLEFNFSEAGDLDRVPDFYWPTLI